MIFICIVLLLVAYVLGSIPSSVWIGKRFYGIDVREHGSRNAGATNTLRVLGRMAALPVFAIDLAKGAAAVLLAKIPYMLYPEMPMDELYLQIIYAAAAVIGHMLPVFAGFKGGKGVATITGAALAIATGSLLLSFVTFIIVLAVFNYVSLASMTAGALFPFYMKFVFHENTNMVVFGLVIACLLIYTHRKNIKRLVKGEEGKIYLIKKKEE